MTEKVPRPSNIRGFILGHTTLAVPRVCPEIRLRLITETCPLWKAGEKEVAALGIPDPYWGFCWPGGQALARFILDHPELVAGKRVLDFGAGCGIEAIASAMAGAGKVLASDTDPMAIEALKINAELNQVTIETTSKDVAGARIDGWDMVLAGDVCYDPELSKRFMAWFCDLSTQGIHVLIADPGRGNLPKERLSVVAVYRTPSDIDVAGKYLVETTIYFIGR